MVVRVMKRCGGGGRVVIVGCGSDKRPDGFKFRWEMRVSELIDPATGKRRLCVLVLQDRRCKGSADYPIIMF
ncbi:hypothetical protein RHMOL_Rhmol09G0021500 [Rhododendron molle]|uniref:Uncharacterized protein n=1 Tax=Rhododendron molle TaxID=49168 RepID=A0ACC0M8T4_RHOML|nr:hypothetical protein RHMOL_Rhmol09G0021500 [Rhododendron molle]